MTFRKNFLALCCATLMLIIGSYLVGVARDVFVAGMTMWLAGSSATLVFEDFFRKLEKENEKITWQYVFGCFLVFLAIGAFLWASESVILRENIIRLGIAVFFGVMGGVWFHTYYAKSIMDKEQSYSESWYKIAKKIEKAKTYEEKFDLVAKHLRYRLVGDSLSGVLDLDRPLAYFNESYMTINEVAGEVNSEEIEKNAVEYAEKLLQEVK